MPMSYPVNPERECKTDGFKGFQSAQKKIVEVEDACLILFCVCSTTASKPL